MYSYQFVLQLYFLCVCEPDNIFDFAQLQRTGSLEEVLKYRGTYRYEL